ncbi:MULTISPECIES: hypothetical protein [Brevibacillus]|uniref:hypothetical protein n=1 Tax=Brevibacillus sp. FSL K6-2834 TaxID=2954680 RepID=UPI0003AB1204|nr:hypothetical protein [Brevibacillus borstelensis]KKX56584.1 hypothetical protein X546_04115 [Brevibacillus borstelensis cifa_chp40]MBE5393913.1 hypothetical protein [Brevibacillus borstelensis]MCC0562854.1 hypothetical protein [Brevibacillus borstelensis]MCM3470303.1 hypothetical protein [Brevibacillus borstelensis]MCM3557122.1 hypothetical protein [Brevibacillus borstelensis]
MFKKLLNNLLGKHGTTHSHKYRKYSSSDYHHRKGHSHPHGNGHAYYGSSYYKKKKRSSSGFFSS